MSISYRRYYSSQSLYFCWYQDWCTESFVIHLWTHVMARTESNRKVPPQNCVQKHFGLFFLEGTFHSLVNRAQQWPHAFSAAWVLSFLFLSIEIKKKLRNIGYAWKTNPPTQMNHETHTHTQKWNQEVFENWRKYWFNLMSSGATLNKIY